MSRGPELITLWDWMTRPGFKTIKESLEKTLHCRFGPMESHDGSPLITLVFFLSAILNGIYEILPCLLGSVSLDFHLCSSSIAHALAKVSQVHKLSCKPQTDGHWLGLKVVLSVLGFLSGSTCLRMS